MFILPPPDTCLHADNLGRIILMSCKSRLCMIIFYP